MSEYTIGLIVTLAFVQFCCWVITFANLADDGYTRKITLLMDMFIPGLYLIKGIVMLVKSIVRAWNELKC